MQRIWVQLCGKNWYKVTILIMHKRERELGFYRHDQWGGCLPCWRYTGLNGGLLLRGWSPSRRHCYRHKHQQEGATWKLMHKHMIMLSMMWMVLVWSRFNLPHVNWSWFEKLIQIQTSNVVQITQSCICYCLVMVNHVDMWILCLWCSNDHSCISMVQFWIAFDLNLD